MGAGSSAQRKPSEDQPADDELVLNGTIHECASSAVESTCPHSRAHVMYVAAELKVETGDQNAVKNMLDDAVTEYFEEKPEYMIHHGWDNVKLLLMALATLTAAVSHFFKSDVISERVIIYSSVGAYVLCLLLRVQCYKATTMD